VIKITDDTATARLMLIKLRGCGEGTFGAFSFFVESANQNMTRAVQFADCNAGLDAAEMEQ
jgi:hypothetical protein